MVTPVLVAQRPDRATPTAPDPSEILRALRLLHDPDEVVEVRAPGTHRGTVSGYYDGAHWQQLARDVAALDCPQVQPRAVYLTLNPVNPEVQARALNRLELYAKSTTSDDEITRRRLLLIDADSVRPKGISATDEEHEAALQTAAAIREFLRKRGWPEPALADSGNGGHLVYRIDLPNDAEATALLQSALRALAQRFDSPQAKADPTTYNASRVCKLYGTVARTGDHTKERPHRLARILEALDALQPVSRELLEAIAAEAQPAIPPPSSRAAPGPAGRGDYASLDVVAWFQKHGTYGKPVGGGKHSVLCPWEAEHSSGTGASDTDTVIWEANGDGGWPRFHCSHAHCEGRGIRDAMQLWGDADAFCSRERLPHALRAEAPPWRERQSAAIRQGNPKHVGAAVLGRSGRRDRTGSERATHRDCHRSRHS